MSQLSQKNSTRGGRSIISDRGLGRTCYGSFVTSGWTLVDSHAEDRAWEDKWMREQHKQYRWCQRWILGKYHSRDRVPGHIVESVICDCVPQQEVQVFGIAHRRADQWDYYFIVRLCSTGGGVLSPERFILSDAVEEETGVLCDDRAQLVRPGCSLASLVEVRGGFQKSVQSWLFGALGSQCAPGGPWSGRCFGNFQLREDIVRALIPLSRTVLLDELPPLYTE